MALNFNLYNATAAIDTLTQPFVYAEYLNQGVTRTIGAGQTGNLTYDYSADYGIYNDKLTVTTGEHTGDYYAIRTGGGNDTIILGAALTKDEFQQIFSGSGNDTINTLGGSYNNVSDGSGTATTRSISEPAAEFITAAPAMTWQRRSPERALSYASNIKAQTTVAGWLKTRPASPLT